MDESPTRDELSGWRSSGASVRTRGAHPGKSPGPLARHSCGSSSPCPNSGQVSDWEGPVGGAPWQVARPLVRYRVRILLMLSLDSN